MIFAVCILILVVTNILPHPEQGFYGDNLGDQSSNWRYASGEDTHKDTPKYWLPESFGRFPTRNHFTSDPGCYIACYSRSENNAVYSVGSAMYVTGRIRVRGEYIGGICHPQNYRNKDIRSVKKFKSLCNRSFSESCKQDGCWAGGNTGGWFGL